MDPIASLAASGLRSKMEALDLLANNLANAGSVGYKADQEFRGTYVGLQDSGIAAQLPLIERHWTQFANGMLQTTSNPLDFAIEGGGFFSVKGPSGTVYTRSGSFHLSAKGVLVNQEGLEVLDGNGRSIQLDPLLQVDVDRDGTIRQGGAIVSRISVVNFKDLSALTKQGHLYFQAPDGTSSPAAGATVLQAKLEGSNVSTADSAVRLVSVLREFEALQKAIGVSTEMNRRVVEDVGRIGS